MRLDFLRPLYEGPGDYASLYLDASRTTEDAAELVALRWRAARERLADGGTDPATLDALEGLVTRQTQSVPGLAAFASRVRPPNVGSRGGNKTRAQRRRDGYRPAEANRPAEHRQGPAGAKR